MLTSKIISNVSFNSIPFLERVLNKLLEDKKIYFWAYIKHFAEKDDTKEHVHFFCIPNGRIDTDYLNPLFIEPTEHNEKPLRSLLFRVSKLEDIYLYMLHDNQYLLSKGQYKKYHYNREDIITSDNQILSELISSMNFHRYSTNDILMDYAINKKPFEQLLLNGVIPVHQINSYEKYYYILQDHVTRSRKSN